MYTLFLFLLAIGYNNAISAKISVCAREKDPKSILKQTIGLETKIILYGLCRSIKIIHSDLFRYKMLIYLDYHL